jgi:protein SCO1/2
MFRLATKARIPLRVMPMAGHRFQSTGSYQKLTWKSLSLFLVTGGGLLYYFNQERSRLKGETSKEQRPGAAVGKALVGGPFSLVDYNGKPVTNLDYLGKWMFLYFGFTHCPDVCPEELERMAKIYKKLQQKDRGNVFLPVFISCDPKRDSVEAVRMYCKDFFPELMGLTGTYEQVKSAAKAYRLYFSAPPRALDDDETDYLVDHSIFFYLVDPNGNYVRHYGKTDSIDRISDDIFSIIKEFEASHPEKS